MNWLVRVAPFLNTVHEDHQYKNFLNISQRKTEILIRSHTVVSIGDRRVDIRLIFQNSAVFTILSTQFFLHLNLVNLVWKKR